MLAEFYGIPLITRMALIAGRSNAASVTVVVGHRQCEMRNALEGIPLVVVENPDYKTGMASSLVTGFNAAEPGNTGVLVMLPDMLAISTSALNRLIDVFLGAEGRSIVCAAASGQRGNPVILPASLKDEISRLKGGRGARFLIESCGLRVIDVEIGCSALIDVDTPEAVVAAGGIVKFD